MSCYRPFIFCCNGPKCLEKKEIKGSGLPRGWKWLRFEGKIVHACSINCETFLREDGAELPSEYENLFEIKSKRSIMA